MLLCFADLVDHVIQYAGADPIAQTVLNARGAAQTALTAVANGWDWNYYRSQFVVNTSTPYETGTITYTNSTRALTLSGGTWPTWAAYGYVVVSGGTFAVASRDSATQLTLQQYSNPGQDIAAGTAYALRRDTYPLPPDFGSATSATAQPGIYPLQYVTDAVALTNRNYNVGTGRPQFFSVVADPTVPQRLAARVWPASNSVYNVMFSYKRRITKPTYLRQSPGLASCVASSAAIAGTGTEFTSAMVGCAIRLGADAKTLPTGMYGDNPAQAEFLISAYGSATALTATDTAIESLTGVKYVITSLLDVEPEAMLEYVFREAERQYRLIARMKNQGEEMQARQEAYDRAREADSRWSGTRTAGPVVRAGVFDFATVVPAT